MSDTNVAVNPAMNLSQNVLRDALRQMYRNSEALMHLRVQAGNRLCAYFFNKKLGVRSGDSIYPLIPEEEDLDDVIESFNPDKEETPDTQYKKILDSLEKDFRKIKKVTTQLSPLVGSDDQSVEAARKHKTTKPQAKKNLKITEDIFQPSGMIQDFVDFVMVRNYMDQADLEESSIKDMELFLKKIPYYGHLSQINGIGVKMAAFIIAEIDIHKIVYASQIISFAGLCADSKGRAFSTSTKAEGCFRFYIEFQTDKVKKSEVFGTFQRFDRHKNAFYNEKMLIKAGGIDDNKKKRYYIGRIDDINDIPNDVSVTQDTRLVTGNLSKLIVLKPDTRVFWNEMVGSTAKPVIRDENTPNYWQIVINGTETGLYVDDDAKYNITCQRSLRYNKDVQAKFIGTMGGCLIRSNTKKVYDANKKVVRDEDGKEVKSYTGYAQVYREKRKGLENRPITLDELDRYSKFKTSSFSVEDLKQQVGPDGDFYQLPLEVRTKIEKLIKKEREGKFHANAVRRMLQQFIINEIYIPWRTLEGLPAHVGYAEGKLGIIHKTGTGNIGTR